MKPVFTRTGGSLADRSYFRHVGSDRWYCSMVYARNMTTRTLTANQIYALPYVEARGGTLDRIGFYCTAGGPQNFRLGIYEATSQTVIYPNTLVVDAGVVASAAATLCSAVINQALQPETLYFLCVLAEISAGTTFRACAQGYSLGSMGVGSGAGAYPAGGYCYVAQPYGGLPAVFPAAGTVAAGICPIIGVRYSA